MPDFLIVLLILPPLLFFYFLLVRKQDKRNAYLDSLREREVEALEKIAYFVGVYVMPPYGEHE